MLSGVAGVPVWRGKFDVAQAERLLWRAGLGEGDREGEKSSQRRPTGAVHKLTHPGREHLVGHKPHDEKARRVSLPASTNAALAVE
jgi:hypothetical protein